MASDADMSLNSLTHSLTHLQFKPDFISVAEGGKEQLDVCIVGSPFFFCGLDSLSRDTDVFIEVVDESFDLDRSCGTTDRPVSQVAVVSTADSKAITGNSRNLSWNTKGEIV